MTSPPEPSPAADTTAALAAQVAALRGQVRAHLRPPRPRRPHRRPQPRRPTRRPRPRSSPKPSTPRRAAPPPPTGSASSPDRPRRTARRAPAVGRHRPAPRIRRLPAPRMLGQPPARHLGTVHPGRRMAPHLQPQTPRPRPGTGIPRPVAARHHAPHRRHHPPVQPRMRRPGQRPRRTGSRAWPAAAPEERTRDHDPCQAHPGRAAPAGHPESAASPSPTTSSPGAKRTPPRIAALEPVRRAHEPWNDRGPGRQPAARVLCLKGCSAPRPRRDYVARHHGPYKAEAIRR